MHYEVPEKVLGRSRSTGFQRTFRKLRGEGSGSTGFRRRFRRRSGRLRCTARSSSSGFQRRFRSAEPGPVQQKAPKEVGEALVQSQVRFNRVPEKLPEKVREALVQSQVKFNRVPEKVPESRVRSGSTGFGRRFRRRCWRLWCRANRVPEKVPEKVWEASVQSQVKFNSVPKKVREKVWEALVPG